MTTHANSRASNTHTKAWCAATIALSLLTACESMSEREKGTAIGAGGGAVAGAAIGVGHTDSTGSDTLNQALSVERAQSVRNYLSVRGVDAQRIDVQGRGSREPVASNTSDSGRAQNRRVEIFLAEQSA